MNAIKKITGIFIILLFATACATAKLELPEKYNFGKELEEVEAISNFQIDSWQAVDFQSLVIETKLNEYYLVILQRPAPSLPSSESIGYTNTAEGVKPGFDNIIIADSSGSESYIIQKVYKLKDREQKSKIKEMLKKN